MGDHPRRDSRSSPLAAPARNNLANHRIALGTVQFGLSYGIANDAGPITADEAAAILDHSWSAGVDTLDTAITYGESEQRLGEIGVAGWKVISKLPAIPDSCRDVAAWVTRLLNGSLERLRIPRLRGLLLHHPQDLLDVHGDALYAALDAVRSQELVEKIGISFYGTETLDTLCSRFSFDLVQGPLSVVDRRFATSGWLTRLANAGTEVHVRSVFLQGLLTMDANRRPPRFAPWNDLWCRWERWLEAESLTRLQACLSFVSAQPGISRIVVGVNNLEQMREVLSVAGNSTAQPPNEISSEDRDLVDPSQWVMGR